MSEQTDKEQKELAERARKLFAGPVEFLKSAPGLQYLPAADYPEIAFAGRSNVGKSSLMNWQAGRLVSVVEPTAGVTRDRET